MLIVSRVVSSEDGMMSVCTLLVSDAESAGGNKKMCRVEDLLLFQWWAEIGTVFGFVSF